VAAAKRGARRPPNRWLDERRCGREALLAMKRSGADALHRAAAPRFAILT
jgi:delta-aminolevulinic acid dehydratase/porphobilinogen synthase